MGKIRTHLVYGNPRFEICGVCDVDREAAQRIAELYKVGICLVGWLEVHSRMDVFETTE
jgi:predicted dehydrogenase